MFVIHKNPSGGLAALRVCGFSGSEVVVLKPPGRDIGLVEASVFFLDQARCSVVIEFQSVNGHGVPVLLIEIQST